MIRTSPQVPQEATVPEQSSPASTANGQRPEASFGELVKDATEQFSTLIRAEVELAKLEVVSSVKRAGLGAAMFGAAGFILLLSIPFLFVALAEGLVEIFDGWRWAAYLIVFGLFLLVAGLLVFIGVRLVKKITKPERTITTVKELPQVLKHGDA
jgi:MFS family permease